MEVLIFYSFFAVMHTSNFNSHNNSLYASAVTASTDNGKSKFIVDKSVSGASKILTRKWRE